MNALSLAIAAAALLAMLRFRVGMLPRRQRRASALLGLIGRDGSRRREFLKASLGARRPWRRLAGCVDPGLRRPRPRAATTTRSRASTASRRPSSWRRAS